MSLSFVNGYSSPVSIMFEFYHPECQTVANDPWQRTGWYNLAPGQKGLVFSGDVHQINRFWYFFAQSTDGAYWNGPYPELVRYSAFDDCAGIADNVNYHSIGMRELDVASYSDYVVTLTT